MSTEAHTRHPDGRADDGPTLTPLGPGGRPFLAGIAAGVVAVVALNSVSGLPARLRRWSRG
jgi:hypothetical protein